MLTFLKLTTFLLLFVSCASDGTKAAQASSDGLGPVGFKLVAVKKASIYDRMGLKKGDILTGYNDQVISSAKDAMGMYEALKRKDKVKVFLKRAGEDMTIEYPSQSSKR